MTGAAASDPLGSPPPGQSDLQATIVRAVELSGAGLHTGRRARVRLEPAPAGHGIVFQVSDSGRERGEVALDWRRRVASRMNTALALPGGGRLRTVEHLAAALTACRIDNVRVSVEGGEIPILDGSAAPWCDLIERAGTLSLDAPRRRIRITAPIQAAIGDAHVRLEPATRLALDVTCRVPWSGRLQAYHGVVGDAMFRRDLAPSRSSGGLHALSMAGILPRGRLEAWLGRRRRAGAAGPPAGDDGANRPRPDLPSRVPDEIMEAVRLDPGEPALRGARPGRVAVVLGPWILGGARFPDELVRHYALDLLGDLALAGAPLVAQVFAHRPTHRLTYALVRMLAGRPDCWEWTDGGEM